MLLIFIKTVLALFVIYTHIAFVFGVDSKIFGINLGAFAVNFFFTLSGYFLSVRFHNDFDFIKEIINRLLRLIPASFFASLFTILIVWVFNKEFDIQFIYILLKNSLFIFGVEYNYNCAFSCDKYGSSLNFSLWTMPFELIFSLLLIFSFKYFKSITYNPYIHLFLMFPIFTLFYINVDLFDISVFLKKSLRLFYWFYLGMCFSKLHIIKQSKFHIYISIFFLFVFVVLTFKTFFLLSISLLYLFIIFPPFLFKIIDKVTDNRLSLDPTFGTYLIGFPVQQTLYWHFNVHDMYILIFYTSFLSVVYGFLSNYLFEQYKYKHLFK